MKKSELNDLIKEEVERLLQEAEATLLIYEEIDASREKAKSKKKAQSSQAIIMATYVYAKEQVIGKESAQAPVSFLIKEIQQVGQKIEKIDGQSDFQSSRPATLSDGTELIRDTITSIGADGQKVFQRSVQNMSPKNDMYKKIEKVQNHLNLARGRSSFISAADSDISSIMESIQSGEVKLTPDEQRVALSLDVLADAVVESENKSEETVSSVSERRVSPAPGASDEKTGESTRLTSLVTTVKYVVGQGIKKPKLPNMVDHHQKYIKLWLRPQLSEESINSLFKKRAQIERLDYQITELERKIGRMRPFQNKRYSEPFPDPEYWINGMGFDEDREIRKQYTMEFEFGTIDPIQFKYQYIPSFDRDSLFDSTDHHESHSWGSGHGKTSNPRTRQRSVYRMTSTGYGYLEKYRNKGDTKAFSKSNREYTETNIPLASIRTPAVLRSAIANTQEMIKLARKEIMPSAMNFSALNYLYPAGIRKFRRRKKFGRDLIRIYKQAINLMKKMEGLTAAFYTAVKEASKGTSPEEIFNRIENPKTNLDYRLNYIAYGRY